MKLSFLNSSNKKLFKKSSNECRHRFSSLFFVFKACTHTYAHAHTLSIHTVALSQAKLCGVKWIPYFTSAYFPGSFWCLPAVSHLQICVSCPELKRPVGSQACFPCLRARPDPAQALLCLVSQACNLILDPSIRDTDLHHQRGRKARCLTLRKSVCCGQKMNSSVQPPPSHEAGISASSFFTLISVPRDAARGSKWSTSLCRKHSAESCQCLSVVWRAAGLWHRRPVGGVGVPRDDEPLTLPPPPPLL